MSFWQGLFGKRSRSDNVIDSLVQKYKLRRNFQDEITTSVFFYFSFSFNLLLPPKASAEGGFYLKGNWLLWSVYLWVTLERVWRVTMIVHEGLLWLCMKGYYGQVYDWLLLYMGHTSMCRLTYGRCHVFWQLLVTIENDDVSTNWL